MFGSEVQLYELFSVINISQITDEADEAIPGAGLDGPVTGPGEGLDVMESFERFLGVLKFLIN